MDPHVFESLWTGHELQFFTVHALNQSINAGVTGDPENAGHVLAHPHVHEHVSDESGSAFANARHVVIAQVFEFGIVAHSIIIGITVGVSQSPCVIRPLFAALTFHQFFEGFALGGCVAQVRNSPLNHVTNQSMPFRTKSIINLS